MSTSRAHVEYDPPMMGVRLALTRDMGNGYRQVLSWEPPTVTAVEEGGRNVEPPGDTWLRLPEDDARALYEALADYYGHAGHDTRALRKDYDAERKRVDTFIAHLTRGTA